MANYDTWKAREPEPYSNPMIRTTRIVCRCGAEIFGHSATGLLSRQAVCLPCAQIESAEHLRRVADRLTRSE